MAQKDIMTRNYGKSNLLRFTCWVIVGAWFFLVASISLFIYGFFNKDILQILVPVFCVFIIIAAIGVTTSLLHRCPNCNRRFLIEIPGSKHVSARKVGGLDFWATVVIDVLSKGRFVCMYCGEKLEL